MALSDDELLAQYSPKQSLSDEDLLAQYAPKEPEKPKEEKGQTFLQGAENVASGFNRGLVSLVGVPVDALNYILKNTPGFLGGRPKGIADEAPGGSESLERVTDALGFTTRPRNTAQRLEQGTGEGVTAMFGPEAVVGALGKAGLMSEKALDAARAFTGQTRSLGQAAKTAIIGGASGFGSSAAEEVAPDEYKPLAGLVGGLATGVPAALATEAGPAIRATGRAIGDYVAPVTNPEKAAANTIRSRADNAENVLQSIAEGKPIVPESEPTTFQQSGDMGLGSLEREVATRNPNPFQVRRAEQNVARVNALNELQPTGDVTDAADLFRNHLTQADKETEDAVTKATTNARTVLDSLGGKLAPEDYGSALRGAADTAADASKARENALWKAIDPDNTLELPMANTTAKANELLGEVDEAAGQQLSPVEQRLLDAYKNLDGPQPFERLRKIRSELSSEIRAASGANPNPQAVRRFTILKQAVDQDIEDAVSGKVSQERQAVSAGEMAPEDTIEGRLSQQAEDADAAGARQATGTDTGEVPAAPKAADPANAGEGQPAGGQSRGAAGNQGVQKATRPVDILQFIASEGGLRDEGGDLKAMNAQRFIPGRGMLIRENGLSLDEMRARAQQEGYLPPDDPMKPATSSTQELLDAIQDNIGGKKVYRQADMAQVEAEEQEAAVLQEAKDRADALGIDRGKIKDRELPEYVANAEQTREAMLDAMDKAAEDAMASEYAGDADILGVGWLNENLPTGQIASRAAEAGTGGGRSKAQARDAGGVRQGASGGPQGTGPRELVQSEAAGRYKTAKQATLEHHQTFDRGPTGKILAEQKGGGYRVLDSGVPAKVFHPGPTGFEDVTSFRKAVGDETALPILTDYAVSDLRRSAMRADGTIDPAALARWQAKHSEALRAFPDLQAKLADVGKATQAMEDAMALRKDTLTAFQGHAAAKLMNATSPEEATRIIGGMLNSKNSVQQIRQLVDQAKGDVNALAGLRRAVADHIREKFISNTEGATTGVDLLRSDQFQGFMRKNVAALRQLFSPEEIASMNAIAADLKQANRSITAVKLPGGSNTPQDLVAQGKGKLSLLSLLAMEGAGAVAGHAVAGLSGTSVGLIGVAVLNALRNAGLKTVDQYLTEALLDPKIAGDLLKRFPARPEITLGPSISRNLRRLSVAAPAQAAYPQR